MPDEDKDKKTEKESTVSKSMNDNIIQNPDTFEEDPEALKAFQDTFGDEDDYSNPTPEKVVEKDDDDVPVEAPEEVVVKAEEEPTIEKAPVLDDPELDYKSRIHQLHGMHGDLNSKFQKEQDENKILRDYINSRKQADESREQAKPLDSEAILNKFKESPKYASLKEYYPEAADGLEEMAKLLADSIKIPEPVVQKQADQPVANVEELLKQNQQLVRNEINAMQSRELALKPINEKYPDWKVDVGSNEYRNWIAFQDDGVQNKALDENASTFSKSWLEVLDMYYQAQKQYNAPKEVTNQVSKTLENATPATGKKPSSAGAPKPEVLSEDDEALQGFLNTFAEDNEAA